MKVGDPFPIEELGLSKGEASAVVYFYPQAGTDGCTLEAHEFNRSYPRLQEAGVRLVGVSIDPADVVEELWAAHDIRSHVQEVVERSTTPT